MFVRIRRAALTAAVPFIGVSGAMVLAGAVAFIVLVVAVLAYTGHPPQITWGSFSLRWPRHQARRRDQR